MSRKLTLKVKVCIAESEWHLGRTLFSHGLMKHQMHIQINHNCIIPDRSHTTNHVTNVSWHLNLKSYCPVTVCDWSIARQLSSAGQYPINDCTALGKLENTFFYFFLLFLLFYKKVKKVKKSIF